jgi:hypothetical protein
MEQELATPMGFSKQKAQWGTEFGLGMYAVHDLLGSVFCLFFFHVSFSCCHANRSGICLTFI